MKATLVVFDLGRVLVRICESWGEAFIAAKIEGAPLSTERLADPAAREEVGRCVHALERGELDVDAFIATCARLLEQPAATVAKMLDAWVIGTYPGAIELLDELRAAGHVIACLSNTNARHWQIMAGWDVGLFERITIRGASHELRIRKPDASIYAKLERLAPSHDPHDIVFFDDLPDNVAAARERGWTAIEVTSREDPVAQMRQELVRLNLLSKRP